MLMEGLMVSHRSRLRSLKICWLWMMIDYWLIIDSQIHRSHYKSWDAELQALKPDSINQWVMQHAYATCICYVHHLYTAFGFIMSLKFILFVSVLSSFIHVFFYTACLLSLFICPTICPSRALSCNSWFCFLFFHLILNPSFTLFQSLLPFGSATPFYIFHWPTALSISSKYYSVSVYFTRTILTLYSNVSVIKWHTKLAELGLNVRFLRF